MQKFVIGAKVTVSDNSTSKNKGRCCVVVSYNRWKNQYTLRLTENKLIIQIAASNVVAWEGTDTGYVVLCAGSCSESMTLTAARELIKETYPDCSNVSIARIMFKPERIPAKIEFVKV